MFTPRRVCCLHNRVIVCREPNALCSIRVVARQVFGKIMMRQLTPEYNVMLTVAAFLPFDICSPMDGSLGSYLMHCDSRQGETAAKTCPAVLLQQGHCRTSQKRNCIADYVTLISLSHVLSDGNYSRSLIT